MESQNICLINDIDIFQLKTVVGNENCLKTYLVFTVVKSKWWRVWLKHSDRVETKRVK